MKKAIALIIVLSFVSFTFAQSFAFVSLQQDYDAVLRSAENQSSAKLVTNENTVSISNQETSTNYVFNEKKLYNVETIKNFDNSKAANTALEGVLEYLKISGIEVMDMKAEGKQKEYVGTKTGEVYKVILVEKDAAHFELHLITRNVANIPAGQRDKYDTFAMDVKNLK
jgi:hypothetical protein